MQTGLKCAARFFKAFQRDFCEKVNRLSLRHIHPGDVACLFAVTST